MVTLYFYFFEETRDGHRIRVEKCEAEERKNSFKLMGTVTGCHVSRINKMEIGLVLDDFGKERLVLDRRDDNFARRKLICERELRIEEKEKEIEEIRKQIRFVDEWRAENEGSN